MSTIAANLQAIRRRISEALQGDSRTVDIVAVSKSQPPERIGEAFAAGCRDFGENYVQEAIAKMAALPGLDARWHYIGRIQANKARDIAGRFDWVHALDRAKHAKALSKARPAGAAPLQVCIQVNISGEATKGGVEPTGAVDLAHAVAALPNLRLRGVMGMAAFGMDHSDQRRQFAILRRAFEAMRGAGLAVDTLSMGMSQDLEAAVEEGATLVRIGTAIFGERARKAAA